MAVLICLIMKKQCVQMNAGFYHRIFADEDLLTSKKPTRWGLMGFIGYI